MPFIVHLKEPRFFAMVMPKLRAFKSDAEVVAAMTPASAVRGLNLYPSFLTDPSGYDYEEIMRLIQQGARQFWESMMGPDSPELPDAEIAAVFRDEGSFVPPHLVGTDGQQSYIIRTQSPKMIWELTDDSTRECSWKEACSELEFEKGTAAAFSFYQQYLQEEAEA